jgi:hypothetical protein
MMIEEDAFEDLLPEWRELGWQRSCSRREHWLTGVLPNPLRAI